MYSEKATIFCEIFILLLTGTTYKVRWRFRKILWPSQKTRTLPIQCFIFFHFNNTSMRQQFKLSIGTYVGLQKSKKSILSSFELLSHLEIVEHKLQKKKNVDGPQTGKGAVSSLTLKHHFFNKFACSELSDLRVCSMRNMEPCQTEPISVLFLQYFLIANFWDVAEIFKGGACSYV